MKEAFGLAVPDRLQDICVPSRCALIIYDMQAGIVAQISNGAEIVARCLTLLTAARTVGFRVFYCRHVFLPTRVAGVGQLRRAMVWQKEPDPAMTKPPFRQGSPRWEIVPELAPREDEVVIDKITMSCFESTYLNLALRDAHLDSFIIAGIALEVGIEPTLRHALDLNYCAVLAADACGSADAAVKERSIATLNYTGEVLMASTTEIVRAIGGR
jgi:nicotinamidase-related amidase